MHYSVFQFFTKAFEVINIQDRRVLDIGSMNVNGSVRDIIVPTMFPTEYIGTDMRAGPYVNVVIPVEELVNYYGPESFDVIISTEMLEHAKDWKIAIYNMKQLLKPNGDLFLTTRSIGFPLHSYPDDYWRFSVDNMHGIFSDFKGRLYIDTDPQFPGVFVAGIKPSGWVNKDLTDIEVYSMESEKNVHN